MPVYYATRLLLAVLTISAVYWWWRPPLYCSPLHAAGLLALCALGFILGEIWQEVRRRR